MTHRQTRSTAELHEELREVVSDHDRAQLYHLYSTQFSKAKAKRFAHDLNRKVCLE